MGDNTERIFDKLDKLNEGLAGIEATLRERSKQDEGIKDTIHDHESRLRAIESQKSAAIGIKNFVGWMIVTAISLWGVINR